MTEDKVSYRELEALLKPVNTSLSEIKSRLDDLGPLSTRVSVLEAGKTNWPFLVSIVAVLSSWLIPYLRSK